MKLNVDVIHINGPLHKIEKFWRIHLFCDNTHICEADLRVLVTTNAANVGIEKHLIALQMQFDWPCDLLTYFQKRGNCSRQVGTTSMCILYADLVSCVFLVTQTRGDTLHVEPETMNEGGGINSAISPRCKVWPANNSQFGLFLGPTAQRRLRICTLGKLHQVVRFFCFDLGCQHVQGEIYILTGLLDPVPATGGCTTCPICT
jgi:hypothetical protein